MSDPLLTVAEVAARLAISQSAVRRLIARGEIPHVRPVAGVVRVSAAAVEAHVTRTTFGGAARAAPELRWVRLR